MSNIMLGAGAGDQGRNVPILDTTKREYGVVDNPRHGRYITFQLAEVLSK